MTKLATPAVPNIPLAPAGYERQYQDQTNNALRLYFNRLNTVVSAVVGNEGGQYLSFPYGSFYDTTTQTAATTSTAYPVEFNTTDLSNSVVMRNDSSGNPTEIVVDETGVYNFVFSFQFVKASSSTKHAWVWPRVNGEDVPNSAGKVALSGSGAATIAAWNYFLDLSANDYVQLMWAVEDTGIQILQESATAFCPAIPSTILTVNFVSLPPTSSTGT